ncbi:MBL fold metallo-hydrolase [Starkeya sp. ORNL1]|uniref:MBL fold metallo-hydrolase n=1 Tax=Starkeya sp. ORNL1 TaxID=2709380 RepID=UPI001463F5A4|nr:MBL fold metallo-hydrolase [Starkeya sp. ORNL1]QJP13100.1 MBL fold metallo-hydrolase [Starkeya sp. ORNL1]
MRVEAISGFGVKGPAAFLVEIDGRRLLLDCGEGPDNKRRPDLSGIGTLDAVLVSHGHLDHIAALDLVPPEVPVFMTALVHDLAGDTLTRPTSALPLRGMADILGLRVTTGRNGHAPGGVWLHIADAAANESLLYTGDVSRESALYPFDMPPPATLAIVDASYGDYDEPLDIGAAKLVAMAGEGPLLLPAPADGRGLEMAVVLARSGAHVRLCPAHRHIAEAVIAAEDEVLTAHGRAALAGMLSNAGPLDAGAAPEGVMIVAKPALGSGLGRELAVKWRDEPSVRIAFTGHVGSGTLAAELVGEGRASFVRWNVHPPLSDLKAVIAAIAAVEVLPAFLDRTKLPALYAALPQARFATSGVMASVPESAPR